MAESYSTAYFSFKYVPVILHTVFCVILFIYFIYFCFSIRFNSFILFTFTAHLFFSIFQFGFDISIVYTFFFIKHYMKLFSLLFLFNWFFHQLSINSLLQNHFFQPYSLNVLSFKVPKDYIIIILWYIIFKDIYSVETY